jgi:hypothetical protein
MTRSLMKILVLTILVIAGSFGIDYYRHHFSVDQQVEELQQQKRQLQQIVRRLSDESRVAEVLVTDQKTVNGVEQTTLLFVEYARDGSTLPPKEFTISGDQAHIDAMVIKFDHDFVEKDDPLRGHSLALFTKLYGENQSPDHAFTIDKPGEIPDYYRGIDPQVSQFEQGLWTNFWKLVDDPAYRQEKGVRVANGQGLWGPFDPDKLYTITIESNGGLNISNEPLKGIYREALKRRGGV